MKNLNKSIWFAFFVLFATIQESNAQNVGIGTATPTEKIHVVGGARVTSLSGVGNRMVISDANGVLGTQAIPTGAAATVNNGLNIAGSGDVHLGGTLIENTTITQGLYSMTYNLNSTGDFNIQDNGTDKFTVFDNGNSAFGGDVTWRDNNATTGTILAELTDDGNDGRFTIMENGLISVDLDANSQFIFNEQGLDRDFRVESNANTNMLLVNAGTNRVGIGVAAPTETVHVQGGARVTSLSGVGNRMVISDANGVLGTQAIPTGSAATANNGLNIAGSGDVHLGGTLIENTTITQGAFGMTYDLNGTGDFRVESNGNANMLFVDGGNNRVGIATAAPTQALHVTGGARISTGAVIGQPTTYGGYLLTVGSANTPAMQLGSMAFNQAEAGRLTFEEIIPSYTVPGPGYCGFQVYHNGLDNTLNISTSCGAEDVRMIFERNGDIGMATNNPTAILSVNGAANKTGGGTWAVFSDRRLKKDISDFTEGLDFITKVRTVNFSYNDKMAEIWGEDKRNKDRVYQGVIAQELQEIAPDMVRVVDLENSPNPEDADYDPSVQRESETFLEVDPNKFTYALINAVKEQQVIIEQLKAEQAHTKKELTELKAMFNNSTEK